MTSFIYVLKHPATLKVMYVGKSVDPKRRFNEHKNRAHTLTQPLYLWLRSLEKEPVLEILEEVEDIYIEEREKYWIAFYPDLLNLSLGGIHFRHAPESIEKIRQHHSGTTHPMYGKPRTQATRQKISESLSGENHPNYGKHLSDQTKQKIRESQTQWFKVTDTYGKSYIIKGLTLFCQQHNLSQGHMSSVAMGKRKHHKGWKCERI